MVTKVSLNKVHSESRRNRSALAKATTCGCFYCLNEYPFQRIAEWTDDGKTAICPCCGVDAVLGFNTPVADQGLLRDMHKFWFERSTQLTQKEWESALKKETWPPRG
jgi:NAD-dependent SIR2 family protein deacetylase